MKNPFDSILGKGKPEKYQLSADEIAVRLSVSEPLKPVHRPELEKTEPGLIIQSDELKEPRRPGRPGRLREYEIRNKIQECLNLRPMGLYELSRSVGSTLKTTEKHAEYLCRLSVCQKIEFNDIGRRKIIYSRK